MNLVVRPHLHECRNFRSETGQTVVTVTIAPIRIVYNENEGKILLYWACSMGRACRNPYCCYSRMGKLLKEIKQERELEET